MHENLGIFTYEFQFFGDDMKPSCVLGGFNFSSSFRYGFVWLKYSNYALFGLLVLICRLTVICGVFILLGCVFLSFGP